MTLFSNSLQLNKSQDKRDALLYRRTILAQSFREERKKGVIPVLVSFLWFVFALGLSVELAFNDAGGNATAHDLALGLLVGWLPVLIVGCTVDRNLTSADSVLDRLNDLIEEVRVALLDPESADDLHIHHHSTAIEFAKSKVLNTEEVNGEPFFEGFGGQGRTHFHYGVAHPILSSMESKFVAQTGRDWLRNGHKARRAIVVQSRNINGLKMWDPRMIWQMLSSIFIVAGTVFAAFVISWFTPTVGLGCRTGGYIVYILIATGALIIEMSTWWLTHHTTHTHKDPLRRVGSQLERRFSNKAPSEKSFLRTHRLESFLEWIESNSFRRVVKNFVLRPIEAVNTGWLTYMIAAQ